MKSFSNIDALSGAATVSAAGLAGGTAPASTGPVRIPSAAWITSRNAANSADLNLWRANASDYLDFATNLYRDDYALYTDRKSWMTMRRVFTAAPTAGTRDSVVDVRFQTSQSGTVNQGRVGIVVQVEDAAAVTQKTITGAANNGSGLVRIAAASHGYATGDKISVYGVLGTTEANGVWTITSITANTFDLQASTFTNAYVSGGTATNRGLYYGISSTVVPTLDRGGLTGTAVNGDDLACFVGYNAGTGKATDAYYLGRNAANFPSSSEWTTTFTSDANADYGIRLNGRYVVNAIDTNQATFAGNAAAIRTGNAQWWVGRNAANAADLNLWRANSGNYLDFGTPIYRDDNALYSDPSDAWLKLFRQYGTPITGRAAVVTLEMQAKQSSATYDGCSVLYVLPGDRADVVTLAVTGATNATPIVVTTASAHGFADGDRVNVYYVAGNAAANGIFFAKRTGYSTTTFGLYSDAGLASAVAGTGTYQAGSGWVTNRSFYYGCGVTVLPLAPRGNIGTGVDDIACYVGYNGSLNGSMATDAYYLGRNFTSFPSGSEWQSGFSFDANSNWGIRLNGTYINGGLDLSGGAFPAGSSSFYVKTPLDVLMPTGFGLGITAPTYGFHQLGGSARLQALATPTAPTTAVGGGTPAGTASFYFVVAEDRAGNRTPVSAASTSAAAGSSTANWRKITWPAVAGAVKYYVLRNTSSTAAGNTLLLNTGTWAGTTITNLTITAGGTGYATAPTVSFYGGQGGVQAAATVAAGLVMAITVQWGGVLYTSPPTLVLTAAAGSGATATVALGAYSAVPVALGTGYALNDVLTVSGGTFTTAATFRVTGVVGGLVTAVVPNVAGVYSVLPANAVATTTSGAGTGCTLTVSWNVSTIAVTAAGTGYTTAPTVSFTGGGGPTAIANVAAGAVTSVVVTSGGAGEILTTIPGRGSPLTPSVVFSGGGGSGAAASAYTSVLEADDSGQAANGTFTLPLRNGTADLTLDGGLSVTTDLNSSIGSLKLVDATDPTNYRKFWRMHGTALELINAGYTAILFTLAENGNVTLNPAGSTLTLSGATSGATAIQATAAAGATTLTLPAATDTLVGLATTDTLTNKTLTSPILTSAAAPSAAQGKIFFDSAQLATGAGYGATANPLNVWQSACFYSQYASSTPVAASQTNSTLFAGSPSAIGTRVMPIGFLVAGRTIRVRVAGIYTSTTTLANNGLTLKLNLISSTPTTVQLAVTPVMQLPIVASNTNATFVIDVLITCRTTGSSGTVFAQGTVSFPSVAVNGTTANNIGVVTQLNATAVATIDTTKTEQIDVTATTGTGTSVVTVTNAVMEVVN